MKLRAQSLSKDTILRGLESFLHGVSQKLGRIIGPHSAREVSLAATPLTAEQERAHEYYKGMTKEQFKKMQEFIAGRSSKKPASKL